jgi:hypothetical protein
LHPQTLIPTLNFQKSNSQQKSTPPTKFREEPINVSTLPVGGLSNRQGIANWRWGSFENTTQESPSGD